MNPSTSLEPIRGHTTPSCRPDSSRSAVPDAPRPVTSPQDAGGGGPRSAGASARCEERGGADGADGSAPGWRACHTQTPQSLIRTRRWSFLTSLVLALFNVIGPMIIHCERRHGGHGIALFAIDRQHVLFAAMLLVPEYMPVRRDCCLFLWFAHHPFLPEILTPPMVTAIAHGERSGAGFEPPAGSLHRPARLCGEHDDAPPARGWIPVSRRPSGAPP